MSNNVFTCGPCFIVILFVLCGCVQNSPPGEKSADPIVCNPPYIRFADSCCLDRNANRVCDTDDTSTSTMRTPVKTYYEMPSTLKATSTSIPAVDVKQGVPDLGANADMRGFLPFPADNPWNQDISSLPVDPSSDLMISSIGIHPFHPDFGTVWNGAPIGIPYVVVSGDQPKVSVSFEYADESDIGPYPIPSDAPIEGGPQSAGDRHILIIDRDNKKLYELYSAYPNKDGTWKAGSGAIFDLATNAMRPAGYTSADAAGLPIFPGLVRYDEVIGQKEIKHALRFTLPNTRRAYVCPARHYASSLTDAKYPPMGARLRLKADYDISRFPESVQVILRALKKYGMILADNGSPMFITGAPDPRWNDEELATLREVKTTDFEYVKMPAPTIPGGAVQPC